MGEVAAVVIGRNEGARLIRCLDSVSASLRGGLVVYVDSGSTDASVAEAARRGASVVELDRALPFTAARARNAGFARVLAERPRVDYVQFIDGDCELVAGWLDAAVDFLDANPAAVVACGRRRERAPGESVYNRLIDVEWDTPPGEASQCGGDALMRASALQAAGGFAADLIAGEEPELCLRLRRAGGSIWRLEREMTLHDAALRRFAQFWRRAQRAGHAYAEAAWRHGCGPERFGVRPLLSCAVWGLGLPLVAVALAPWTRGLSLGLLLAWAIPIARSYGDVRRRGYPASIAVRYAAACWLGKFAEACGGLQFAWNHGLRRRASRLIEYK